MDAETPAKALLRARPRGRPQPRRLPRAARRRALVRAARAERVAYVELHAHSAYSFFDGASLPAELATGRPSYGYEALALTDHDNVCGAMEFAQACGASASARSTGPS